MELNFNVPSRLKSEIQRLILLFILGLVISGVTAFPLEWELGIANGRIQQWQWNNSFSEWINLTYNGVHSTNSQYPFISYGTDWLGFAHLIIAVLFVGPLVDPIKNKWVIEFGIIACLAILPFAFLAGEVRSIPVYWRMIDCMFGVIGGLILFRCHIKIKQLEKIGEAV